MTLVPIGLGSARPCGNGETVAHQVHEIATKRDDSEFELDDVEQYDPPSVDEHALPSLGQYAALFQQPQLEPQFDRELDGCASERTRIARELHDTLLQSFQGVLLKLQAVSFLLPHDAETRTTLETVIEQARQAIAEGRDVVHALRSPTVTTTDLADALAELGAGLAAAAPDEIASAFCVEVDGVSRDLAPLVRGEVYRIAGEAVRNAFRHARAPRITVEIRYGTRQLWVRVRDNGSGIDRRVVDDCGLAGHFGLVGMRERAELIGGALVVSSKLDTGTDVVLTVPGSIAYATPDGQRQSGFFAAGFGEVSPRASHAPGL